MLEAQGNMSTEVADEFASVWMNLFLQVSPLKMMRLLVKMPNVAVM
jgi:hypothetical protein